MTKRCRTNLSHITTIPPHAKLEAEPRPQYNKGSDRRETKELTGRLIGTGEVEIVPTKIKLESTVFNSMFITGFMEEK